MSLLSAVIIAKDAAETIEATLKSITWVDEIIVIDDQSQDTTGQVAAKFQAKLFPTTASSFCEKRNEALKYVSHDWILYIDADEEVTPELASEIKEVIQSEPASYRIQRKNFFLGREMYPDAVERLFHRQCLRGWTGEVHETANTIGLVKNLKSPLIHRTHRNISSMLSKTNEWSELEARLRYDSHHPPIKPWRLIRIGLTYFWQQFLTRKVWRFGREGVFEGYFQIIDKLIVYTKLWEIQNKK